MKTAMSWARSDMDRTSVPTFLSTAYRRSIRSQHRKLPHKTQHTLHCVSSEHRGAPAPPDKTDLHTRYICHGHPSATPSGVEKESLGARSASSASSRSMLWTQSAGRK
eukprot:3160671-Rhodomonas_salina.2